MIKNFFCKIWQHKHSKHFRNELGIAFIKALANTLAGGALIVLLYCFAQTEVSKKFLNRITGIFEKYVQVQEDINKKILDKFKKHEVENDSLKSKNKKHDSKKEKQ